MREDNFENPTNFYISDKKQFQLKVNRKAFIPALLRTAVDAKTGKAGGGTLVAWKKAASLKKNKEAQLFLLISNALENAIRAQIKHKLDYITYRNSTKIYEDKALKFDLFSEKEIELAESEININFLNNPNSLPFIRDFKPYYQSWLNHNFSISELNAHDLAVGLPDYFAYEIYNQLTSNKDKYLDLIDWSENPIVQKWQLQVKRNQYKQNLKSHYRAPALGERNIALMDVYVKPTFGIYENILKEKARKEIKENHSLSQKHFLPFDFQGGIHQYMLDYFIEDKIPEGNFAHIDQKRLLVLLGQPGHGKSSFCYRTIHDLLKSGFNGHPFFIRLQNANRDILNQPKVNILDLLPKEIEAEDWIDKKYNQKTILFLDGLDEMFMTHSLSDNDVLLFINNCKNWLRSNPNLYIVITSRFNYIETSKLYNQDCLIFKLGTLNTDQQKELVKKYLTKIQKENCNLSPVRIDEINEEDQYKHLKELIELPILLQMILISNIQITADQSKAKIYDNLFKTVLERKWDKEETLKKYKKGKFKPIHLRKYLSWLAFKIFQNKRGYINKSEIVEEKSTKSFVNKYLRVKTEADDFRHVLKDVLTSFYLKETRKNENDKLKADKSNDFAIEFLHKSLYEYLMCEYLWQETKRFFLKEDEDGDIETYDDEAVQTEIQRLFALTRLTRETIEHLKEIIANDTDDHDELMKQMSKYLPKLLKKGFIYEFKREGKNQTPIFLPEQQTLHCFHAYILILGELNIHKMNWDMEIKNEEDRNIFIKKGQEIFKTRIKAINKEKDHFIRLLRLGSSEQLSLKLNFSFVNYENAYLRGVDLSRAYLSGAYLSGAYLSGADLSGADLRGADLRGADLSGAYLSGAYLSGAYLSGAYLRSAYLRGADLSGADLSGAYLSDADLSGAYLSGAYLSGAYLRGAYLRSAYLRGAYLRGAYLSGAYLRGADLSRADLRGAYLRGADLSGAYLSRADLSGLRVSNLDWIKNLESQKVIGSEEIAQEYKVAPRLKSFNNKYGNTYQAYELIEKPKE